MPDLHYATAGSGAPLLILHGLFGSSKNWHSYMRRYGEHFEVFCVDLRNHGQSFHSDLMDYALMADDVAGLIAGLGLSDCRIIGHSMGGKTTMALAQRHPEMLSRMVVADIAPVTYAHQYDDLIDPILRLDLTACGSRAEVDAALKADIPEDSLRSFLMHNLARGDDGFYWRVNFAAIKPRIGALTGFDALPPDWQCEIPTQFIRGGNSDYVGDAEIRVIERHFPGACIDTIDGAGHWLHAEKPADFVRLTLDFLQA